MLRELGRFRKSRETERQSRQLRANWSSLSRGVDSEVVGLGIDEMRYRSQIWVDGTHVVTSKLEGITATSVARLMRACFLTFLRAEWRDPATVSLSLPIVA